jgi:serine/threonine protein kinase
MTTSSSGHDPAFADLLDELLEAVQNGGEPDLAAVAARHPAAAARVDEAYRLALGVAGRRSTARPSLHGYRIERELGRGGMGTVYLARQVDLDREVALKVLPQSFGLSAASRRRFLDEARALARVEHEHIVAIHRIVDDGELLAFEMEFVDGPSLHDLLAHLRSVREAGQEPGLQHVAERLGVPLAELGAASLTRFFVRLGLAMARALGAVHAAGFVHRDVKPANILLRHDGRPVLADFGLVRDTDLERTQRTGFVGTPVYSSPEQLRGGPRVDASADVYALGVTLYECLTLAPPFAGRTSTELLARIEAGRVPPLRRRQPDAPRDLETILVHAMELDPARRYRSGDAFADDLQRLLDLRPIAARPISPLRRLDKFVRRNRGSLLAGLAGAALVALALLPALGEARAAEQRRDLARQARQAAHQELLASELRLAACHRGLRGGAAIRAILQQSLAHYTTALRHQPADVELRRERAAVRLALWQQDLRLAHAESLTTALASAEFQAVAADLPPLAREFAIACVRGDAARWPAAPMAAAEAGERHSIGLLAYLLGEPDWCELAWGADDGTGHEPLGPLRNGVLGQIALAGGAAERAFVRLATAQQALAEPRLALALADAALALGEAARAAQWYDRADPAAEPSQLRERLAADLQLARGDSDGARCAYRELAQRDQLDPTASLRLVQLTIRDGDLPTAASQLERLRRQWPLVEPLRQERARVALLQRDAFTYLRLCVEALAGAPGPRAASSPAAAGELLRLGGLERLRAELAGRDGGQRLGGELPLAAFLPARAVAQLEAALPFLAWLERQRQAALAAPHHVEPLAAWLGVVAPLAWNRLPGLGNDASPWRRWLVEALPLLTRRGYPLLQPNLQSLRTALQPSTWRRMTLLAVPEPTDLARGLTFGASVVLGADWTGDGHRELLVAANAGSPTRDLGQVFVVDGLDHRHLATVAGTAWPEHLFAFTLAVLGDLDGDGHADWLVGAPAGVPTVRTGLALLFSGATRQLLGELRGDVAFGVALAGLGDVDQDGVPDFAVGCPPIVRNASSQGTVTVFSGRTRVPLYELRNPSPGTWFGAALAGLADVDGDGAGELLVGGNYGDAPGQVLLYSGRRGTLLRSWASDDVTSGFGASVAAGGDLTGDGGPTVAIGCVRTDPRTGLDAVAVYDARSGELRFRRQADRQDTRFGTSLASWPGANGARDLLLVGATRGGGGSGGTVQLFDGAGRLFSTIEGPGAGAQFGHCVIAADDRDGDGQPDLYVTSPGLARGFAVSRILSSELPQR